MFNQFASFRSRSQDQDGLLDPSGSAAAPAPEPDGSAFENATTQPLWSIYQGLEKGMDDGSGLEALNYLDGLSGPQSNMHDSAMGPRPMQGRSTSNMGANHMQALGQHQQLNQSQNLNQRLGQPLGPHLNQQLNQQMSQQLNQQQSRQLNQQMDLEPSYLSQQQALLEPSRDKLSWERKSSATPQQLYSPSLVAVQDKKTEMRRRYKVKSSIPPDVSSSNYSKQCIAAASSSGLPPFHLHTEEYNLLRNVLSYVHVTTYLNIRNGILRLWLSNPLVRVTKIEAAGCARDERFYGLAEVAYEWLVRFGYINFGCVENFSPDPPLSTIPDSEKRPRQTIIIVGAGIAGLACARQLDNLLQRYPEYFVEYEDLPRVLVLEGRRRIGGRIYSAPLQSSDQDHMVDLGADTVRGFGNGNPLAVLARRQLGLPVLALESERSRQLYDGLTGQKIDPATVEKVRTLFEHIMGRMADFQAELPSPSTARGDEVLMRAAKDFYGSGSSASFGPHPDLQELQTIGKLEENGDLPKQYEADPSEKPTRPYKSKAKPHSSALDRETEQELEFLARTGFPLKRRPGVSPAGTSGSTTSSNDGISSIHVAPEPVGEVYPSLGHTVDAMIAQLEEFAEITPLERRLLNWFLSNLEYLQGTNLDYLSLGHWNRAGVSSNGRQAMFHNGYISVAKGLYVYPERLDVRFKTTVKVVEYDGDKADVFLENGDKIHADRAVITVPLGVLKDRAIQFIPDLPQWKTDSIERLGYGVTNKICLVFDKPFWDESQEVISITRDSEAGSDQDGFKANRGNCSMFVNATKVVGKPCVMGYLTGDIALEIADKPDDKIVEAAMEQLEAAFPAYVGSVLVESVVTRWQADPFARGSFSYVGLEATPGDFDILARPIGDSLFFAGEATCRTSAGTVQGAYLSGLRAANEVLTSLIGEIEIPQPLILAKDTLRQSSASVSARPTPPEMARTYKPINGGNRGPGGGSGLNNIYASAVASPVPPMHLSNGNSASTTTATTPNGQYDPGPPHTMHHPSAQQATVASVLGLGDPSYRMSLKRAMPFDPTPSEQLKPATQQTLSKEELNAAQERLAQMHEKRLAEDAEQMRHDMIQELGERPVKPEREGANPFLIFQKDFWEKCRDQTDAEARLKSGGGPTAKATRNEVRTALGKMWRELPEDQKKPYLDSVQTIKEENSKNMEAFRKRIKQYDADAEDFRRRWKEQRASGPSEQEQRLMRLLHEFGGDEYPRLKKR